MTLMSVNNHGEQGKDHRAQPRWSAGKTEAVLRLLRHPSVGAAVHRSWAPSY
jgi:hypothetical protein